MRMKYNHILNRVREITRILISLFKIFFQISYVCFKMDIALVLNHNTSFLLEYLVIFLIESCFYKNLEFLLKE